MLSLYFDLSGRFDDELALIAAIATSLACIIFTSSSAAYAQYQKKMVNWEVVRKFLPWLVLGSFSAGYLIPMLPATVIKTGISLFLACLAVIMISSWQPPAVRRLPGHVGSSLIGLGAGLVSGSAGIAGGNVIVPTLVYLNVPPHNATATSSVLGIPIAVMGTLGYFILAPDTSDSRLLGYVDIFAFIPIVVGSVIFAPIGVKVAHKIKPLRLKKIFGLLLIIASARMLIDGAALFH